jgi:transcriptional regulator with XRE-family HTH domain
MKEFGEVLRELREKRGLTVNQLGIYSGVSPALISKIENGKRGTPKPETLEKLAKGLKIPYEELMILAGHIPKNDEDNEIKSSNEDELEREIDITSVDDIIKKYNFKIDGRYMTEEEAKDFLAFVRTKRSLK